MQQPSHNATQGFSFLRWVQSHQWKSWTLHQQLHQDPLRAAGGRVVWDITWVHFVVAIYLWCSVDPWTPTPTFLYNFNMYPFMSKAYFTSDRVEGSWWFTAPCRTLMRNSAQVMWPLLCLHNRATSYKPRYQVIDDNIYHIYRHPKCLKKIPVQLFT